MGDIAQAAAPNARSRAGERGRTGGRTEIVRMERKRTTVNEMMFVRTGLCRGTEDGDETSGRDFGRRIWRTGGGAEVEAGAGGSHVDRPQKFSFVSAAAVSGGY